MTPRSRKVCVGCRAGHFEETVAFPFGRRRRQYSMEDTPMTSRLRFGVFLAPFHKPGINPTLALQNDLDLVAWLDRLGYDEAWFGENHSAGTEISASPEIMIAVAAERTRHIKLGTGGVSLSYHNPLWVAERIVLLDHLTRGRAMFGAGPGSLPTDRIMIGVPQSETRELLEQSLDVIMRLLAGNEAVTFKNHRWDLRDARLHLRPYSNPLFDVAVAAVASPTGAKLAGRHGIGLLSVGATTAAGFDALALHWDVLGEEARVHGKTVDRSNWRLVGPMHCAETKEQAIADVQYGIEHWFRYFQAVAAFPQMAVLGDSAAEMIDFISRPLIPPSAPAPRGLNSLVCMPKLWRLLANVTPRSVVRGRIKGRIEWSFVDARTIIGSMIASFQHRPIPPTCPACQARMKLVLVGGVERRACKCQDCARQDRNAA